MPLECNWIRGDTIHQPIGMLVTTWEDRDGDENIVLDPPFQRGSVWTPAQRVAWIESVLMGIPLPAIFINRWPFGHPHRIYGTRSILIDGKQRFEATRDFMQDKFTVRGETYSHQGEAFGRRFRFSSGIGMTPIIITSFATLRECAELYVKLLRAGTAHTEYEIEKAERFAKKTED